MKKLPLLLLVLWGAVAFADRKGAETLKQQGDAALAEGKRAEAGADYEKAIAADPSYTDAYDAAAPIWFSDKQYDVAIAHLKQAVAADPKYAAGWYNLGFAYRKTQAWQDAVDAYTKFTELKPDEPDPYFGLAMSEKALGQVGPAEAALQKYLELEKRPEKQKFVAEAQETLTMLKGATTGVDAASIKKEGDDLRAKGDAAGAEAKYRDAIEKDRTYEPAYNELGTLLVATKLDEAIGDFETAVKLSPGDDVAWYNLAYARRKAGQHAKAIVAYQKYIELKPENPDPYYGLAQSQLAINDSDGARATLTKYLNLETRPTEKKFVAKAKEELAALDKPSPAGPQSMPASPTSNDPHVKAGDELFASKEYFKAAEEYKQADPHDAVARYHLGVALAAKGDLAGAMGAWEATLLLDPKNERARRNLELARKRMDAKGAELDDGTALVARARDLVADGRDASAARLLATTTDPDGLALRADARLAAGDENGALADYAAEVAARPRAPRAYRALAEGWLGLGDKARAKYFFQLYFLYADSDPAEAKLVPAERKKASTL